MFGTRHLSMRFPPPALGTAATFISLFAVLSTAMMAQQNSSSQASSPTSKESIPKFTARTELVTVPVVVLRRVTPMQQLRLAGWLDEHVAGLTKDDFEIEEDGKPKPIATFEEVRGTTFVKAVTPPPGIFTNEVGSDGPVSMVIILLDLINTSYLAQEPTKKKLLEYLQRDYRGDRPTMLMVLGPNGLRLLHDFTADPQVLVKAVRRMKSNMEHDSSLDNLVVTEASGGIGDPIDIMGEYAALDREFMGRSLPGQDAYDAMTASGRLETTFDALQQLARALSSVRGMKSLVWASGGFAVANSMSSRDHRVVEQFVQTMKLLSAAGVAVYPIAAIPAASNAGYGYTSPQLRNSTVRPLLPGVGEVQKVQNMMAFAQQTGGDYCLLSKDPDLCFKKAVDFDSQYYLLSYYAQASEKAVWRKIQVKAHGADLVVRARSGYFSSGTNDNPEERRKRDIAQAFVTPVEYRGLAISVRWTTPSGDTITPVSQPAGSAASSAEPQLTQRRPKQPFVLGIAPDSLTVDTADNNHIQLSIVALALDRDGKVLAEVNQQIVLHPKPPDLARLRAGGFVYSNSIEVPSHTAKVRFIVRDDLSERVGTISTAVAAQP